MSTGDGVIVSSDSCLPAAPQPEVVLLPLLSSGESAAAAKGVSSPLVATDSCDGGGGTVSSSCFDSWPVHRVYI